MISGDLTHPKTPIQSYLAFVVSKILDTRLSFKDWGWRIIGIDLVQTAETANYFSSLTWSSEFCLSNLAGFHLSGIDIDLTSRFFTLLFFSGFGRVSPSSQSWKDTCFFTPSVSWGREQDRVQFLVACTRLYGSLCRSVCRSEITSFFWEITSLFCAF